MFTGAGDRRTLLITLASLALIVVQGEPRPRLIAKVSNAFCRSADNRGGKGDVALSTATVSRVATAAAAAVGLTYHRDLPAPCWLLLNQAESKAATQAAIQALLSEPAVGLMSEAGDPAADAAAVFELIAEDQKRYTSNSARRHLMSESQERGSPAAAPTQLPSGTRRWRQQHKSGRNTTTIMTAASARPQKRLVVPASLPTECSSGTCFRLWGMNRIYAPAAWLAIGPVMPNITRKGMIVDTGVDMKHFDIIPQVDAANSITYADPSNLPAGGGSYKDEHGTHVFGTAAGGWGPYNGQPDPNNIAGVAGPTQNQIVSCNAFGRSDGAYDSDIISCLAHARRVKAHYAVNLSLGGTDTKGSATEQPYKDAFAGFCAEGGMAIVAAGNGACVGSGCPKTFDYYRGVDVANSGLNKDGTTYTPNKAEYPAYMAQFYPDCVLAVANIQRDDTLEESSNWGELVLLAAPGTNILSDVLTSTGGNWAKGVETGTSMAAPHVTGAIILLRNSFPDATNTQVKNCLVSSSDRTVKPRWPSSYIEGGVLNVKGAYDCLKVLFPDDSPAPSPAPLISPSPDPTPTPDPSPSPQSSPGPSPQPSPQPSSSPQPSPGLQPSPPPAATGCGDCSANGLCKEADGCKCVSGTAGNYCSCNSKQGFIQYTADIGDGNGDQSYCVWNVRYTRSLSAKTSRGAFVFLDFNVLTDSSAKLCTVDYVIESVQVDRQAGLFKCPSGVYRALSRSTDAAGDEICVSRTKLNRFTFQAVPVAGRGVVTRNLCARFLVTTTDGWYEEMTLQYTN